MESEKIKDEVYSNLPIQLQNITKRFSDRERDMLLLSSITVLSSCLPNYIGYYGKNRRKYHPHLYFIAIAPAASGKGIVEHSRHIAEKIDDKLESISKKANNKSKSTESSPTLIPPIKQKIISGNSSTSVLYSAINENEHGVIMIDSEADTVGKMLQNDWSNYSDVLRKVYHHEGISQNRKTDNERIKVKSPKLAMALAGTPEQLRGVVESTENGLFSRFLIYNFNEKSEFQDVFEFIPELKGNPIKVLGNEIYKAYGDMIKLNRPQEFSFSDKQKIIFVDRMRNLRESYCAGNLDFDACIKRHAIMWFRIAMIFSKLKNLKQHSKTIECTDEDFESSYSIIDTLLKHCYYTFSVLGKRPLPKVENLILEKLNDNFTSKELVCACSELEVKGKTVYNWKSKWLNLGLITFEKQGHYSKVKQAV